MTVSRQEVATGLWLVQVSGRLDHSQSPRLEAALGELLDQGRARIIVDLSAATYINSGGLRCLISGWRRARELGGQLVICCLDDRLSGIFSMVGLDQVIPLYDSVREAQARSF